MENNELLQSIRLIIKEDVRAIVQDELQPVIQRLDGIDVRLDGIDVRLDGIDSRLEIIEHVQNDDNIVLLKVINEKMENCATKEEVAALARLQGEQFLRIEMLRKAQ